MDEGLKDRVVEDLKKDKDKWKADIVYKVIENIFRYNCWDRQVIYNDALREVKEYARMNGRTNNVILDGAVVKIEDIAEKITNAIMKTKEK